MSSDDKSSEDRPVSMFQNSRTIINAMKTLSRYDRAEKYMKHRKDAGDPLSPDAVRALLEFARGGEWEEETTK